MPSESRGICSTCNYVPACSLRATDDRPVFYCEEFDDYVPVAARPAVEVALMPKEPTDQCEDEYKGLCLDCDNREICLSPKSHGGVWHCEEYR